MTEVEDFDITNLHPGLCRTRYEPEDPTEMVRVQHWDGKRGVWLDGGTYHRFYAEGLLTAYSARLGQPRRLLTL